ncbi:hypothetical protein J5N97_004948 [Dioscorea zingiberensis]|uniref:Cytochrome P450 n=1 Tax=Dioscorea zingiberensis TaxID=325984 RepID=A0A9D5D9E3_9LILI|nr:hypothetical protein J5N97_004948 [Dioscorea zingiberensis]
MSSVSASAPAQSSSSPPPPLPRNASLRTTSSLPIGLASSPPSNCGMTTPPLSSPPSILAGELTAVSLRSTPYPPLTSPNSSPRSISSSEDSTPMTEKGFRDRDKVLVLRANGELGDGDDHSEEDFVPLVRWLGFSSMRRRIETTAKELDEFLQGLIEERRKLGIWKESSSTIIDIMLALQEKEPEDYNDVSIKGILESLITGGMETTPGTMEWTMALLLNHPEAMTKARAEIEEHVGHARLVMDSDISKLRYLNNVIKETLRLFPAGPLLIPHESSEDCTVAGLHVPKGTMLLVNVYAMQRDPELWEDPLEFKPERFDAEISNGDQGYKYKPFGSGRRRCPGETMAWKVMGLTLATLIQCFQWERVGEEVVDLSEGMGLTMPMTTPMEVMYKPYPDMLGVLSQLQ